MASELYVETLKGLTSGANANKVIIPAGQTLYAPGHVIQVVSTTKSDVFSMTSTTFTDVTGLSVSITPSSTSSKILVFAEIKFNGQGSERTYFRLMRDSTAVCIGDAAGSRPRISAGGHQSQSIYTLEGDSINYLDSPATTSATTYKVQMRGLDNENAIYVNRSRDDRDTANYEPRSASTITVMEIAG